MKKTLLLSLLCSTLILVSCASKNNKAQDYSYDDDENSDYYEAPEAPEVIAPVMTDDFLGDFGIIEMQELMVLKKNGDTVKPRQIKSVYLIPKTNTVEINFRDLTNAIAIDMNKTEREKIMETCRLFLQQYEEKTLPHQKVNSKTAFMNSKIHLWWGVVSPEIECSKCDYFMNVDFINKRPYLLINFLPSRCDTEDCFTPNVKIYMSPTQIREFLEVMDQENLNSLVTELNEKAYTY